MQANENEEVAQEAEAVAPENGATAAKNSMYTVSVHGGPEISLTVYTDHKIPISAIFLHSNNIQIMDIRSGKPFAEQMV